MTDGELERALIVAHELLEEADQLIEWFSGILEFRGFTAASEACDYCVKRKREAVAAETPDTATPSPQAPGKEPVQGTTPEPCHDDSSPAEHLFIWDKRLENGWGTIQPRTTAGGTDG